MRSRAAKPWWHANAGWIVSLALAVFAYTQRSASIGAMVDAMPGRRDRELDQQFAAQSRQIDQVREDMRDIRQDVGEIRREVSEIRRSK